METFTVSREVERLQSRDRELRALLEAALTKLATTANASHGTQEQP
jgi:hypothetical protein